MNSENKILIVVNPISGDLNKDEIIEQIKTEAKTNEINVEVYKTTGKNDKANIIELVKKNTFKKLLIVGGDGTIKLSVAAVMDIETSVAIGIIPAGSANGMAVELNLPLNITKAIQFALYNNAKFIDILNLNDEYAIHISDIGINAALVKNYDRGNIRGKLGYALQSIPTLINFKEPFHYEIEANGLLHKGKAIMVAMANARKYGSGAIINPNGKIDDGKFEILIFKSLQITKILETIFNEVPVSDDFVEIISTKKAIISTKIPVPFQIDGEYYREITSLAIKIANKQIKIIC